jgi:hypothetical protein
MAMDYRSGKIFSNAFNLEGCPYNLQECSSDTNTAVWNMGSTGCGWVSLGSKRALITNYLTRGKMLTISGEPITLSYKNDDKNTTGADDSEVSCSYKSSTVLQVGSRRGKLIMSDQDMAFILLDKAACKLGDVEHFRISQPDNSLRSSHVNHATQLTNKQIDIGMRAIWAEICRIQTSRYYGLIERGRYDPTGVVRAVLKRHDVIGEVNGDVISAWTCTNVSSVRLRPVSRCYDNIPITYNHNNHEFDGFLIPGTLDVVSLDTEIMCTGAHEKYFMHEGRLHVWDGKVLAASTHSIVDNLMIHKTVDDTPIITIVESSDTGVTDWDDWAWMHINSLSQRVQSLARTLGFVANGGNDLDPKTLADMTADAGLLGRRAGEVITSGYRSAIESVMHALAWPLIIVSVVAFILLIVYIRAHTEFGMRTSMGITRIASKYNPLSLFRRPAQPTLELVPDEEVEPMVDQAVAS